MFLEVADITIKRAKEPVSTFRWEPVDSEPVSNEFAVHGIDPVNSRVSVDPGDPGCGSSVDSGCLLP